MQQEQTGTGRHRLESKRQLVLRSLKTLSGRQRIQPELLHRIRIDLRHLEAWLDLVGKSRAAETLNSRISPFSSLRTFHVLSARSLATRQPISDIRKVRAATRRLIRRLAQERVMYSLREAVEAVGCLDRDPDSSRQRTIWRQHRAYVTRLLETLRHDPKRKRLHDLRLQLKWIRYQLEQLRSHPPWEQEFLTRLKQAQDTLGRYEERAAFRKLAMHFDLRVRPAITKRWRRARKLARALPCEVDWLLPALRLCGGTTSSRSQGIRASHRVAGKFNADLTDR